MRAGRAGTGDAQLVVGTALLAVLALVAVAPRLVTRADPDDCSLSRSLDPPSWAHPAGVDLFGCDLLAQVAHGARTSLLVVVLAVAGAGAVAVVLGVLAAWAGGVVDAVVARATDVWSGIPLVLGGVVLLSGTDARGPLQLAAVLALFTWPPLLRVVRSGVRQAAAADHVAAARALGAGPLRLLRVHVLPAALRPAVVVATGSAAVVVTAEAVLTYAGVGLARPVASWGLVLAAGQDRLGQAPHLLVAPGLALVATVAGFTLVGEGLRRRPPGRGPLRVLPRRRRRA